MTAYWPSVQIAQSCGRIALGSNPATGEAYFVDTATAALYPAPRGTPCCPLPSPDGSKITYATDAGGTDEGVAVLALDDQNQRGRSRSRSGARVSRSHGAPTRGI